MPLPAAARHHRYHAIRADLPRRLGRTPDAIAAYDAALTLATNAAERNFLQGQRDVLDAR